LMRLLQKVLIHAVVIVPLLLWLTETGFYGAFITSISITLVSFFINEKVLLKATNPLIAALDAGFTALVILWIYTDYAEWSIGLGALLTISVLFTIMEWFTFKQLEKARTEKARP
jgi:hypothetical protein